MKISKIRLQNFRAYDEPFELDLSDGRNLLLHGENGSGKSSLYQAFRCFFNERGDEINRNRNLFADVDRPAEIRITFQGDPAPFEVSWTSDSGHPIRLPSGGFPSHVPVQTRARLLDASRRSGFLDYRSLLRTNLYSKPKHRLQLVSDDHKNLYGASRDGLAAQLFDLATEVVLAGVRVDLPGGTEGSIGQLTANLWNSRPRSRHKGQRTDAAAASMRFNQAFAAKLPEIEPLITTFLSHFSDHRIELSFDPVSVNWNITTLNLDGAVLIPNIKFRGREIDQWQGFLNEARLSALAICLFLAGTRLSDNDYENPDLPRFLFLDDALIGLEIQNRLPILDLLKRPEFCNYQIFLFTHDRVWFELARGHLPSNSGWCHHELIGDESAGHLIPKSKPCSTDLEIAERHLANGDLKAAAVYARSAFEWKLRKVCEKKALRVSYKANPAHVSADALWTAIKGRQREREREGKPDFIRADLIQRVEVVRSNVLNRLSHAGAHGLVAVEVQNALATIHEVQSHSFPNS